MSLRKDLKIISEFIEEKEKILDVGCGEGDLIDFLSKKLVDCRGIELSQEGVNKCVEKGLTVIQGDANSDLQDYPNNVFTTVILSQTIHAMSSPEAVIMNLIRIGKRAIISFPNFAYWKIRLDLLFRGRMPKNDILPHEWYNTPNIHLCSISDFEHFCKQKKLKIIKKVLISEQGYKINSSFSENLMAYQGVYCISKRKKFSV